MDGKAGTCAWTAYPCCTHTLLLCRGRTERVPQTRGPLGRTDWPGEASPCPPNGPRTWGTQKRNPTSMLLKQSERKQRPAQQAEADMGLQAHLMAGWSRHGEVSRCARRVWWWWAETRCAARCRVPLESRPDGPERAVLNYSSGDATRVAPSGPRRAVPNYSSGLLGPRVMPSGPGWPCRAMHEVAGRQEVCPPAR